MKNIWLVEVSYDFGERVDIGYFSTEEQAREAKRDLEGIDDLGGLHFIKYQLEYVHIFEVPMDTINLETWATEDAIAKWEARKKEG